MHLSNTLKDKDFIALQGSDLITKQFYEDRGSKRVTLPFLRVRANMDTNEVTAYKIRSYERYDERFYNVCVRIKNGRTAEQLVYFWLTLADIKCRLLPMVLDGDKTVKAPDIHVAQRDDNGNEKWYSLEVKTVGKNCKQYTDDISTFPKRIRVDSVYPYDKKRENCTRDDVPLLGVVKVASHGGGVLYIADDTKERWDIKLQDNYWKKKDPVYWADSTCLQTFASLVSQLGGDINLLPQALLEQPAQQQVQDIWNF